MNAYYVVAAFLTFAMGIAHSLLGEKYFLVQLFKRDCPPEIVSATFINRTTRIAWHLTTVAWWSAAGILLVLSRQQVHPPISTLGYVISLWFLLSALISAVGSHGRHLSWIVFLLIGILTWLGTP